MLHRSTSSRRRRASRSAASSPQTRPSRSAATSPGRRASIAVSPVDSERANRNILLPEINRSPRHSIIPDISFDSRESLDNDDIRSPRLTADINLSPRNSLIPDSALSPRNSLVPDCNRSPRHSLVPGESYQRSPRNSLIPDSALSPRNSLVPDSYNRSPRNSLVPDNFNKSPRNSLVPDIGRSPRHSLVPDSALSPRNSLVPDSFNRSPRNSLVPDPNRSPRQSLTPSESTTWVDDAHNNRNRSPRGSIAPETAYSTRTSPRGSIASEHMDRSPRGSIGPEYNKSPRGSLVKNNLLTEESSSRGPRGSLTLTFQEPPASERRASADNSSGFRGNRSTSPYRSGSRGAVNMAYTSTGLSEGGSRRASSSVSQVSGDEQRRLCAEQKFADGEQGLGIGISLTTYGSVAYQLKDANLEASGTCDFICKALSIVNKTVVVTIVLVCLSTLPLLMLIMGVQFLRDCPKEPHIPLYMVVGGVLGCIKMACVLYSQLHQRRVEVRGMDANSIGSKVVSFALSAFLIVWFILGNYWILKIMWPEFAPALFSPNQWCHKTLYVFSVVHLVIIYGLVGAMVVLVIVLACCQLLGCSWLGPTRYK